MDVGPDLSARRFATARSKPVVAIVAEFAESAARLRAHLDSICRGLVRIRLATDAESVCPSGPVASAGDAEFAVLVVIASRPIPHARPALRAWCNEAARPRIVLVCEAEESLHDCLTAKNTHRVDRVFGRHVSREEVATAVTRLVAERMVESGACEHFILRPPRSPTEARAMFALRYRVYAATKGGGAFLPSEAVALDIDAHDSRSLHLCVFASQANVAGIELVGCTRLTAPDLIGEPWYLSASLCGVERLAQRVRRQARSALPLLDYHPDSDRIRVLLQRSSMDGLTFVEAGRLAVAPAWRGGIRGTVVAAKALAEGAAAVAYLTKQYDRAFICCVPQHVRFYEPFGMGVVAGTGVRYIPSMGVASVALSGTVSDLPKATERRLLPVARRYAESGSACRCSFFPACSPDLYNEDRFAEAQMLCPRAATDFVRVHGPPKSYRPGARIRSGSKRRARPE